MKTIYTFQQKTLRFLSLLVGAITVTACGSYQNSSYYDNDGVYGPDKTVRYEQPVQNETIVVEDNNKYSQQFKNMEGDFGTTEVLTDVDNYKSTPDTVYVQESNTRYAGWGENQTGNTTVTVYDNWGWNNGWYGNNWGWNNGWYGGGYYGNSWGWNNGWYGGGFYGNGWGWNNGWYGGGYYGNGWYGNGYYGGGRNVAYNNSPRGGYVNRTGNTGRYSSGRTGNTIGNPRTQTSQPRGNAIGTPRNQTSEPRTISNPRGNTNTGTPRNQTSQPRTYNPRGNTNTGTPRSQTSEPRTYNPRNDSPRTISTPRSSDFGGGRSSGGGSMGGGRSGGGGRGGR